MKVSRLDSVPFEPVSHDPKLKKKVLQRDISCVERISHAVLAPGDRASTHSHPDAFEVFYFAAGAIVFKVVGKEVRLRKGDCLLIEPGEAHSIEEVSEETEMIYILVREG